MNSLADSLKRTTWNLFSGNQLTFGPGAIGTLTGVLHREKTKRVLVVSDQALVKAGIVSQAEVAIQTVGTAFQVFSDGEVEPSTSTVKTLVDAANEFQPDLFVALGGGSNMDLAKAAAATFGGDGDVGALFGFDQAPQRAVKLVCIPTTAGTGSEVTHSAILKESATGKKAAILSQRIRPDVAIVDPQLTISCPQQVTAESGIDALTHAIEAYLVRNFFSFSEDLEHGLPYEGSHPLGDMYAEKAIRLIGRNLKRVIDDPDDLAARSGMALAATLAGAAFSSCGVSLAHALEYPLGATYQCSHGVGNGIVLPGVMQFWSDTRQARLAQIAAFLGVEQAEQMQASEAAQAAIHWVTKVRERIGLPTGLLAVGGKPEDIPGLAAAAMSLQRLLDLSPTTPTLEDLTTILKASL
ncbi:MAG: hypothetical protein CBE00_13700 [Planctomycetaceae bacterium TMED240]|nr:alcohol dehydrogenase [Rhodopirellula sp.]OUX03798.1 MAG: hypothetical protein CBE00_13700 [Planctomycetaceae bacterium TMED240]